MRSWWISGSRARGCSRPRSCRWLRLARRVNVGDNVLVYVMQPETPEGHPVVSIKRARQERQWRIAQEQYERGELLEAEVIDFNKGGLIVNLEGIRGFVPISQILNLKRERPPTTPKHRTAPTNGGPPQLKIIEINRNRNRPILSERLAVQEWRARSARNF